MKRPRLLNAAANEALKLRLSKKMKCRALSVITDLEEAADKQRRESHPTYSIGKHIELLAEYLHALKNKEDAKCT